MPEKEQDSNEQKKQGAKKKLKATTGAWWKSTVVDEDPGKKDTAAPQKKQPRSRASKKPAAQKAKPVAQEKAAETPEQGTPLAKDQGNEAATLPDATDQKKKTSSSRSRRPRRPRKPKTTADEQQTIKDGNRSPAEVATVDENPVVTKSSGTDETSTPKQPEKKPRPSRGRRGGRKKTTRPQDSSLTEDGQSPGEAEKPDNGANTAKAPKHSPDKNSGDKSESGSEKQPVVKLLINAEEPEECRLALLEDGRLESIHVSTVGKVQTKNNIYKARIVAIEPNLQAAFIDYGTDKNGFLPFSEIHPEYYKHDLKPEISKLVESHQWKKLSISDVLDRGQELLVQVVKEEIGTKGANMTTYLSLPGRCVVLMPGSDSEGISRRISGEVRRNQLRDVMRSLSIPEGIGWIVRTASVDITKTALSKDVRFLLKLWKEIKAKGQHMDGVGLLYQDYNCVMRFLREYYDPCIQEILVDGEDALEKVKDFVEMLPAKQRKVRVKHHKGARPIFNQYSVEDQIESIYQPRVNLPSGGSIVIDPTEALVAIDVNSGSTSKGRNFEETIFQANSEAATELARQLRLRDLGGLIVVDFIDMRNSKHIREVERQVKAAMKRDKAKVDISRISRFGLMQISRQKMGSPIESGNYRICEHCRGRGTVRSVETLALFYFRRIHTGASRRQVTRIDCRFPLDVAEYLLNHKRQELIELEEKYHTRVLVTADPGLKPSEHEISFIKVEKEETGKKQA